MKKEIFSKKLSTGRRNYYFDIHTTEEGDYYLKISENVLGGIENKHHSIMLFENHAPEFIAAMNEALRELKLLLAERRTLKTDEEHKKEKKKKRYPKANSKWTDEDNEMLKEMYNSKVPLKTIADTLERTVWSIELRIEKLGLK